MIFEQITNLITIVCIACVIVMLTMAIDLAAGLYKAKQRGEKDGIDYSVFEEVEQ